MRKGWESTINFSNPDLIFVCMCLNFSKILYSSLPYQKMSSYPVTGLPPIVTVYCSYPCISHTQFFIYCTGKPHVIVAISDHILRNII